MVIIPIAKLSQNKSGQRREQKDFAHCVPAEDLGSRQQPHAQTGPSLGDKRYEGHNIYGTVEHEDIWEQLQHRPSPEMDRPVKSVNLVRLFGLQTYLQVLREFRLRELVVLLSDGLT